MNQHKLIAVIDTENNGLWGAPIAIAAVVFDNNGEPVDEYFARLPDNVVTDRFARDNVLPAMAGEKPTHFAYEEMLQSFAKWYLKRVQTCTWLMHLGYITEAFLFRELRRLNLIEDMQAPYPFIDVGTMLYARGLNATSVEDYAHDHQLTILTSIKETHHPIRDCVVTAAVYFDLMKKNTEQSTATAAQAPPVVVVVDAPSDEVQAAPDSHEMDFDELLAPPPPAQAPVSVRVKVEKKTQDDEDEDADDKTGEVSSL